MGGQLDSKIGEVGGQLHRELGKVVVGRGVKMVKVGAGGRGEVVRSWRGGRGGRRGVVLSKGARLVTWQVGKGGGTRARR